MYFMLGCRGKLPRNMITTFPNIPGAETWNSGERLAVRIPTPLRFELDPDAPGIMREMYDTTILVMRSDLIDGLNAAGVDNLECFEAIIRDPRTGQEYTNYFAVNIVGTIACVDLAKSGYDSSQESRMVDMEFDSIAIDDAKAGGALFFRLAESVSGIVVHEKVKALLEARGLTGMTYTKPEDWIS